MKPPRFRPVKERQRQRSNQRFPQWLLWTFLAVALLSFGLHLLDLKIKPSITLAAQAVARRVAVEALNSALTEEVAKQSGDNELVDIERNSKGDFRTLHFNLPLITNIQREANDNASNKLQGLAHETFRLPFTQFMGGSLFAPISPSLPVKLILMGTVHSSVVPEVKTVGINQSVHILYLEMTAEVNVVAPFISAPISISTKAPLTYIVISGVVPNSFYGGFGLPQSPQTTISGSSQ